MALSDQSGLLRLFAPPPAEHREFNVSIVGSADSIPVDVRCSTLDEWFAESGVGAVSLMKIDVEGAEPLVLRGGQESLRTGRVAALVCEMNAGYLRALGSSQKELYLQIEALGFLPATVQRGQLTALKCAPALLEKSDPDLLFVHQTHLNRSRSIK